MVHFWGTSSSLNLHDCFSPSVKVTFSSRLCYLPKFPKYPMGKMTKLDSPVQRRSSVRSDILNCGKYGLKRVQWPENFGESKIISSTKCPAHVTIENSTELIRLVNWRIVSLVKTSKFNFRVRHILKHILNHILKILIKIGFTSAY